MPELDRIGVQFRGESFSDTGQIEGCASAFNVIEPGYDTRFLPGAFKKTLSSKNPTEIKMLLGHEARVQSIVGLWQYFDEREAGLFTRGQVLMDLQDGKDTFIRAKSGALDSLSIGFVPVKWEDVRDKADQGRRSIRNFLEVDLWEVSFVVFRGNPGAKLSGVRSIKEAKTKRDLENALHSKGLSRSDALYVSSLIRFGADADDDLRDAVMGAGGTDWEAILAGLRSARKIINGG